MTNYSLAIYSILNSFREYNIYLIAIDLEASDLYIGLSINI